MIAKPVRRTRLTGKVVSDKMDRTAVVKVTRRFPHPIYKKYVTQTKKYHAQDNENRCRVGDEVVIEATRPQSKLKRWRVREVLRRVAEVDA